MKYSSKQTMIPQRQVSRCSFRAYYPSLGALLAVTVLLLVGGADGFRQRPFSATKSCQYYPPAHQDSHISDITSPVQKTCLQLRGGSAAGVLTALIRTAIRNPILVLCKFQGCSIIPVLYLLLWQDKTPCVCQHCPLPSEQ
jgi:hypothetical protein